MAVNALTLHAEIEQWNPTLMLIAANGAARDLLEGFCVASQRQERPILVFTEEEEPFPMRAAARAAVSAYVVAELSRSRLRTAMGVVPQRFSCDQRRLSELSAASVAPHAQTGRDRAIADAMALLHRREMTGP